MNLDKMAQRSVTKRDTASRWTEEHLIHNEANSVVSIAPHGGQMEPHTVEQAFQVGTTLLTCSAWSYCGYVNDGSAREKYYTTSTDISVSSHEFLPELAERGFEYAVAFHGYSPDFSHPDVYVGGSASRTIRDRLAESIARYADIEVEVAQPSDGRLYEWYAGRRSDNIVNRLGKRGLQLEQTRTARDDHGDAICRGVAEVIAELVSGG